MKEELIIYETQQAITKSKGKNYLISPFNDGKEVQLCRDKDFGNPVIKSGKKAGERAFDKPILYKAGAEKIALGYGLLQHYEPLTCIEHVEGEAAFFYYMFRCDLVKLYDGKEYIITSGFGSANTSESRNGFNSAYNAANNSVKIAKKRALVDAAISIGGLSDLFTQDIENEDFMKTAYDVATAKDDDVISPKQRQRIFAIAAEHGMSNTQTQNWLKAQGFVSAKDIKQKDYDALCDALDKTNNTKNESGCKLL